MKKSNLHGRHIILGVSGSIAAYKAVALARELAVSGATVTTVMTANAQRFVGALSFQTVTRQAVITDLWSSVDSFDAEHVALAKTAECLVVAPATANIIGKAALGLADDALSCLLMTVKCPVIYAPAMNSGMFLSPAVQRNIKTLVDCGCQFVGPGEGKLADGSMGIGRLADQDEILTAIKRMLDSE
jgi:phosphopantothenoylcysteine synthetase/decarboxylase